MTPPPAVRETVRRLTAMSTERWLVLALVLAVLSLGLPWSPADRPGSAGLSGLARFSVAGAITLALVGWRRRRRGPVTAAALTLVLSVFVVSRTLTGGAAAVLLAAASLGVVARRTPRTDGPGRTKEPQPGP